MIGFSCKSTPEPQGKIWSNRKLKTTKCITYLPSLRPKHRQNSKQRKRLMLWRESKRMCGGVREAEMPCFFPFDYKTNKWNRKGGGEREREKVEKGGVLWAQGTSFPFSCYLINKILQNRPASIFPCKYYNSQKTCMCSSPFPGLPVFSSFLVLLQKSRESVGILEDVFVCFESLLIKGIKQHKGREMIC